MIFDSINLKIRPVDLSEAVDIQQYAQAASIVTMREGQFLIVKRMFENTIQHVPLELDINGVHAHVSHIPARGESLLKSMAAYDDKGSILVDMQGISSLIFARAIPFPDATVRKLLIKTGLLKSHVDYFRIGVAGGQPDKTCPSGEVVECSFVSGRNGGGISKSHVGFLAYGDDFSKTASLLNGVSGHMTENRLVYSQTAWLGKGKNEEKRALYIKPSVQGGTNSFFDFLNTATASLGIKACALQVVLTAHDKDGQDTVITGRVGKRQDARSWKSLEDATSAGVEKSFALCHGQTLIGFGTKFNRCEPDWTLLSNGRAYERRGHIHATIIGPNANHPQHKTFHLRDIAFSKESDVSVAITPISDTYRIYPLEESPSGLRCKASHRPISTLVNRCEV